MVDSVHGIQVLSHVVFRLLEVVDLLFLRLKHAEDLVQVHTGEDFELAGLGLKLIEALAFRCLVLKKLLLLTAFLLDIIFQALDYLLLCGDLLLGSLDLLLQNLLPLLALSELLPKSGV